MKIRSLVRFVPLVCGTVLAVSLGGCTGGSNATPLAPIAQTGSLTTSSGAINILPSNSKQIALASTPGTTLSVSSNNPTVATVSQSNGIVTVTGISPGTATVTIVDSLGNTTQVQTIVPYPLVVSPSTVALVGVGSKQVVAVTEVGYTGTFTITSQPSSSVATVAQNSAGVFIVTAVGSGSTTFTITDGFGQSQVITVGVTLINLSVQ